MTYKRQTAYEKSFVKQKSTYQSWKTK